mgnify:CR=1 FL=1
MSDASERLLEVFSRLDADERESLLAFAEFLESRRPRQPSAPEVPAEPVAIPRPDGETVVQAVRRLSETYPMLDKSQVLHESSNLMAEHMLQGRDAVEVIDELEGVFERHYRRHTGDEAD